jgi:hypothetical protein
MYACNYVCISSNNFINWAVSIPTTLSFFSKPSLVFDYYYPPGIDFYVCILTHAHTQINTYVRTHTRADPVSDRPDPPVRQPGRGLPVQALQERHGGLHGKGIEQCSTVRIYSLHTSYWLTNYRRQIPRLVSCATNMMMMITETSSVTAIDATWIGIRDVLTTREERGNTIRYSIKYLLETQVIHGRGAR